MGLNPIRALTGQVPLFLCRTEKSVYRFMQERDAADAKANLVSRYKEQDIPVGWMSDTGVIVKVRAGNTVQALKSHLRCSMVVSLSLLLHLHLGLNSRPVRLYVTMWQIKLACINLAKQYMRKKISVQQGCKAWPVQPLSRCQPSVCLTDRTAA